MMDQMIWEGLIIVAVEDKHRSINEVVHSSMGIMLLRLELSAGRYHYQSSDTSVLTQVIVLAAWLPAACLSSIHAVSLPNMPADGMS